MRNQVEIEICNVRSLEIWRPKRQHMNYAPQRYMLKQISPASGRRLIQAIRYMGWDYSYHESWFESGYGYDFNEHNTFSHPATRQPHGDDPNLALWLMHLLGFDE